jgi:acetyl-CoA acetyltransferase
MALLKIGDIRHSASHDVRPIDKVCKVWVVTLRSASDLLQVPGLDTNDGCASLTTGVSAASFYVADGESLVALTGGSNGTEAVVVTLHREGLSNNLSLDRRP